MELSLAQELIEQLRDQPSYFYYYPDRYAHFLLEGTARRAALIGSLGPVAIMGLALVFLGETMSWAQLLGSALVLAGVMLVSLR
ncbi:MAG: hypothetical protein FIA97_16810 [Methylococcaceae bacterium]|nr:hypothetical protein [Methylococcaceae bacterium]